jgi:hypothetical protein
MKCLLCRGSGRRICPICGGNLKIEIVMNSDDVEMECSFCFGKGLVPCPNCWGTGEKK